MPRAGNISNGSECINPCGEDFFCLEESGICVPACSTWSDSPRATAKAIDVLVILFACIGLLSAVGVLVVSCVRYKHVYVNQWEGPQNSLLGLILWDSVELQEEGGPNVAKWGGGCPSPKLLRR